MQPDESAVLARWRSAPISIIDPVDRADPIARSIGFSAVPRTASGDLPRKDPAMSLVAFLTDAILGSPEVNPADKRRGADHTSGNGDDTRPTRGGNDPAINRHVQKP
jgi:hypothetical protein